MSKLVPDGASVASVDIEVPLYSIFMDRRGRVWERNGVPPQREVEWRLIGGAVNGLQRKHYKVDAVSFPVTILARYIL